MRGTHRRCSRSNGGAPSGHPPGGRGLRRRGPADAGHPPAMLPRGAVRVVRKFLICRGGSGGKGIRTPRGRLLPPVSGRFGAAFRAFTSAPGCVGVPCVVSARALMSRWPRAGSLAHPGMSPHRSIASRRFAPSARIATTGWLGAVLYRGRRFRAGPSSAKTAATSSHGTRSVNRPHLPGSVPVRPPPAKPGRCVDGCVEVRAFDDRPDRNAPPPPGKPSAGASCRPPGLPKPLTPSAGAPTIRSPGHSRRGRPERRRP